ncbi:hypothetical protein QQF64_012212 [Cirrhinus molitorella]|uniref:Uncharacterized protein n=1 Tax=Cirrhinus molitorella TaxID=172907 RepID=A0ABR3LUS5_9TELE
MPCSCSTWMANWSKYSMMSVSSHPARQTTHCRCRGNSRNKSVLPVSSVVPRSRLGSLCPARPCLGSRQSRHWQAEHSRIKIS